MKLIRGEKQQEFGVFFFQMERLAGDDRPALLVSNIKPVLYDAARQGEAEPPLLPPDNDILRKRIDHCGNPMLQMKPIYGAYGLGNLTKEYW